MSIGIVVLLLVVVGAACFFTGFFIRKSVAEGKVQNAEKLAKKMLQDAEKEVEARRKEISLEAKDELYKARQKFEEDTKSKRSELQLLEKRFGQKEESLDRKVDILDKKEREVTEKEKVVNQRDGAVKEKEGELDRLLEEGKRELQKISGLSLEEAKKLLLKRIESQTRHEAAALIKKIEDEFKEKSDKQAKKIITLAIQRYAADHTAETTVSVVPLPNDEMKGRIIGREGRNIRALETATGIDVIIDDTPEAVVLSGFDLVRKEIARISLERLIADGRIHPTRIEEVVEKVKKEMDVSIREAGEQATFDLGIHGLHAEIIRLLGRLKYRTSYGQNVLQHSKEVAYIASMMASEIGTDPKVAKRAGLLHDIGKGIDQEVEGPHALLGSEAAKRHGESMEVIRAIAGHHCDEEQTLLAVLIQAADAVSGARPGARRETLEAYVKRLEKLEKIAYTFRGVERAYAIQAGREIRVIVEPDRISDENSVVLAKDIARKIEEDLEYPGQIKVTTIRETRSTDFAK